MVVVGLVAGVWDAMRTEPPHTVGSVLNEYETEYAALRERLTDVAATVRQRRSTVLIVDGTLVAVWCRWGGSDEFRWNATSTGRS